MWRHWKLIPLFWKVYTNFFTTLTTQTKEWLIKKIFEKRNIDVLQNKCGATASADIIEQMLLQSDIQTLLYGRKTLGKLKYTWILNNASSSSLSPREFSENLFKDGCYISLAWGYKFCFTYFCFTLLTSAWYRLYIRFCDCKFLFLYKYCCYRKKSQNIGKNREYQAYEKHIPCLNWNTSKKILFMEIYTAENDFHWYLIKLISNGG